METFLDSAQRSIDFNLWSGFFFSGKGGNKREEGPPDRKLHKFEIMSHLQLVVHDTHGRYSKS